MAHGLMISFSRTLNIQMLQVAVLILWTFAGFVLFHNVPLESGSRFDTLPEAFLTVLHAITSRSYNMLRLSDYYAQSTVSAVFFVGLTLAGDLVCTNLIIAVGNRQYRLFGIRTFRRQLKNRRQALIAIHETLSDKDGFISRSTWLGFCSCLSGKYAVKRRFADLLFNLEALSSSNAGHARSSSVQEGTDSGGEDVIDCEGLFRLCALLSIRVRVEMPAQSRSADPVKDSVSGPLQDKDSDKVGKTAGIVGGGRDTHVGASVHHQGSMAKLVHNAEGDSSDSDTDESEMSEEETRLMGDQAGVGVGVGAGGVRKDSRWRSRSRSRSRNKLMAQGRGSMSVTTLSYWDEVREAGRYAVTYSYPMHVALPCLSPLAVSLPKDPSLLRRGLHALATAMVHPWNIFFVLVRALLVAQLLLVSTSHRAEWVYVGWAIEALFWVEMLVLIAALGWGKYFKRNGYGYIMALNVGSLVVMILKGSSTRHDGYKYYALLVIQICRFFRFSRFLKGFKTFYAITPLILRVFFIIFAIIYIFADFAHNRMCSSLNPDNIHDEDDDSEQWLNYQHVLNFRTYLQSVLTLYEVATLGNWSPVMGAAAQTDPVLSLLFFYTYRLTMTLAVFPLLFAFIIQAFITRRDLDDEGKGKSADGGGGNIKRNLSKGAIGSDSRPDSSAGMIP